MTENENEHEHKHEHDETALPPFERARKGRGLRFVFTAVRRCSAATIGHVGATALSRTILRWWSRA